MPVALATLADTVPEGDGWVHEVKLDGYRIEALVEPHRVRLISRNGKEWTDRFPQVVEALQALHVESAVLDGEVVIVNAKGVSSFQALQQSFDAPPSKRVRYYAFDLLALDGHVLTQLSLDDRADLLKAVLKTRPRGSIVRPTKRFSLRKGDVLEQACAAGEEGVISKRRDAKYLAGRGRQWIKTKCNRRQEFVIVGYTAPRGSRTSFGALLLGVYDDAGLQYAGKVGTGFDRRTLKDVFARLKPLRTKSSSLATPESVRSSDDITWVTPMLVAEVVFTEWTTEGLLRHPSFQGLREDKDPRDIRREQT